MSVVCRGASEALRAALCRWWCAHPPTGALSRARSHRAAAQHEPGDAVRADAAILERDPGLCEPPGQRAHEQPARWGKRERAEMVTRMLARKLPPPRAKRHARRSHTCTPQRARCTAPPAAARGAAPTPWLQEGRAFSMPALSTSLHLSSRLLLATLLPGLLHNDRLASHTKLTNAAPWIGAL